MADIRLNLDRLQEVHVQLGQLAGDFDRAEGFNNAVADAAGYAPLGLAVGTFANWWNLRREQLITELRFISESTRAIHDTFRELDEHMVGQVGRINVEDEDA